MALTAGGSTMCKKFYISVVFIYTENLLLLHCLHLWAKTYKHVALLASPQSGPAGVLSAEAKHLL